MLPFCKIHSIIFERKMTFLNSKIRSYSISILFGNCRVSAYIGEDNSIDKPSIDIRLFDFLDIYTCLLE